MSSEQESRSDGSPWRPFEQAKAFVHSLGLKGQRYWYEWVKAGNCPSDIPHHPHTKYSEWAGWADWLGKGKPSYRPFEQARDYTRSLGLRTYQEWKELADGGRLPPDVPKYPMDHYRGKGWTNWGDFLGRQDDISYRQFTEAREYARSLKLGTRKAWRAFARSTGRPNDIPVYPEQAYRDQGWIGFDDWLGNTNRWTRPLIFSFLESLKPIISDLQPAEMFAVLRHKNIVGRDFRRNRNAGLLAAIERLCGSRDVESGLSDLANQLESEQNPPSEEPAVELDEVSVESLGSSTPLPSLNNVDSLRTADLLVKHNLVDDEEILDFLVQHRVEGLWQKVFDNDSAFSLDVLRTESGGEYFTRIVRQFEQEYLGATQLQLPDGYSFARKGVLQPPNMMQRLLAYRLRHSRRIGNWSGVGAGKTLAAILASRVMAAHVSIIVAANATVDRWKETILTAFPDSHVIAKERDQLSMHSERPTYFVFNYESFQQEWSETMVVDLCRRCRVDFIVLDEIQSVRQRTEKRKSTRRDNVRLLIDVSQEANPDLRVLGMSATPVVNNLFEALALLELVTGEDYSHVSTVPSIANAVRVHQELMLRGMRYRPKYSMSMTTSFPEVDGSSVVQDLRLVPPRNLLRLEQVMLKAKLPDLMSWVRPGTLIYTQFVEGIVDTLRDTILAAGLRPAIFTGQDKTGLAEFIDQRTADILIGSAPVGTGVDGLQRVCNRLVFACLPWTAAEYEQIVGRLHRQGSEFDTIEVIVPQVVLKGPSNEEWSWDRLRWQRIQWRRTLADAAVDGVIPQGRLPSREEMQRRSLAALEEWLNRVEGTGAIDGQAG